MDRSDVYNHSYMPYIVKWGKTVCWVLLPLIYLPTIALLVVYGAKMPLDATVNGIIAILSASFAVYLSEPLSVFPILGTPGLYLICISGNSKQIRVPAALMAQDGAGVEQGTPEGGIMSSIGVATSMFISILVMTVMIFMGKWILGALPDPVVAALPMLLPALFGALLAQQLMNHPRLGAAAVALAAAVRLAQTRGLFGILPVGGGYAPMLICVFGTIGLARIMYKMGWLKEDRR